jgi:threonine dehydrogenase-like Zn-dependent dehydrogenase
LLDFCDSGYWHVCDDMIFFGQGMIGNYGGVNKKLIFDPKLQPEIHS